MYRNDTLMFRKDMEWDLLTHFVELKYKNVEKVNVYDFGCSDGSEVYTFLISLLNNVESGAAKKFVPIKAYDIDKVAIKKAKYEGLSLSTNEKFAIDWNKDFGYKAFFNKDKKGSYKPNDILSRNIIFKQGDIIKDYKKIKKENSIVFARNFWPYLGDVKSKELARNLGETMGDNSLLIIGDYDLKMSPDEYEDGLDIILSKAGFKKTIIKNVYEKRPAVTN